MTFANASPSTCPTPGPKASLTESEVITLAVFSQWARFRSERDFYRYASQPPAAGFPHPSPAQPVQPADPALLRNPGGFLPAPGRPVAGGALPLRSAWTVPAFPQGTPNAGAGAGCPDRPTLAGATAWAGMRAFTCCFPSTLRASSLVSALPRPAPRTRHWPRISSPSGILPTPGCPPWGRLLSLPKGLGWYVADKGFREWHKRWQDYYGARLISPPKSNSKTPWPKGLRHWLAGIRSWKRSMRSSTMPSG